MIIVGFVKDISDFYGHEVLVIKRLERQVRKIDKARTQALT